MKQASFIYSLCQTHPFRQQLYIFYFCYYIFVLSIPSKNIFFFYRFSENSVANHFRTSLLPHIIYKPACRRGK
ncbi:hypothetical protein B14911_22842 [Bacillus sp. NRRL B-14911]|nr:hypothetical protein B14911_22842 [Bacillus sp. NRRL B-14911]